MKSLFQYGKFGIGLELHIKRITQDICIFAKYKIRTSMDQSLPHKGLQRGEILKNGKLMISFTAFTFTDMIYLFRITIVDAIRKNQVKSIDWEWGGSIMF